MGGTQENWCACSHLHINLLVTPTLIITLNHLHVLKFVPFRCFCYSCACLYIIASQGRWGAVLKLHCVSFNPSNLIEIFLQMKINRDQRQRDCHMIFAELRRLFRSNTKIWLKRNRNQKKSVSPYLQIRRAPTRLLVANAHCSVATGPGMGMQVISIFVNLFKLLFCNLF